MSTKPVFVDFETTLTAEVANVLATPVWDALGEATTPADALSFLNGVPETDQSATLVVRRRIQWVAANRQQQHLRERT